MDNTTDYHGYIDRFSIIGQCVVVEGWANELDLSLLYRGQSLALSIAPQTRPDLAAIFGPEAQSWGFSFAAALPEKMVDRTKFSLRLNAGMRVDPAEQYFRAEDTKFTEMVEVFKRSVAPGASMLEIGSRARSGASYRDWFAPDIDYVGLDVSAGPNVDVVADAHHMSRAFSRRFDHMFSIAVFEHILMPWKVAIEMNALLNPGGTALIISHGAWPLHEQPWDFFRFSTDAWRGIFNAHTGFEVVDSRYQYGAAIVPQYPHSVHHAEMSLGETFLLSGCLVRRSGNAQVKWDAEAADVYNLAYSHS